MPTAEPLKKTTATIAGEDEDTAEFSSLATGDFEIVHTQSVSRKPGAPPPGTTGPRKKAGEDESGDMNLATGDFESADAKDPKRSRP